jgi:hypothetical protein
MPKRVIDFDAMWGSDKLAACAEWAQAEYAWLYGLADASGCFELTNMRVIWGRVAAIRRNLSLERLEQIFQEFHDQGLVFVWEENGKRYGHWTGSDVPGRLPPPSWRMRLERLAPPVPKQQLAEFMSRFSRGRANSPGGGFRVDAPQGPLKHAIEGDLNEGLEPAQAQDWNWNGKEKQERRQYSSHERTVGRDSWQEQTNLPNPNSNSEIQRPSGGLPFAAQGKHVEPAPAEPLQAPVPPASMNTIARGAAASAASAPSGGFWRFTENVLRERDKSSVVARELNVGRGPQCGPVRVKPEALERIRLRNATRDNSRSP